VDEATVEMTLAWWCMPYLAALYWVAALAGRTPRDEHVTWILAKAARFTVHRDG
jgi:hypothetical protein